jgi:hypothetical protein
MGVSQSVQLSWEQDDLQKPWDSTFSYFDDPARAGRKADLVQM